MNQSVPSIPKPLRQAQSLANTLDSAIRLPVIGYRIGLDGILGLVPGVGDVITVALAGRIVWLGHKLGLPRPLVSKMLRNVAVDFVLGAVPLVGDVADFFFKANQRNVKLMEQWWLEQHRQELDESTRQALHNWQQTP